MNKTSASLQCLDTDATTSDALFDGRLVVVQPRDGYRFAVDSPLLVWFASRSPAASLVADLGCGSGVVGLGLLAAGHAKRLIAIELQSSLARLAEQNAELNALSDRFTLIESDVRQLFTDSRARQGSVDLVVANPPYWPKNQGQLSPCVERRIASHEMHGELADWIRAGRLLMHPKRGHFCLVYPARRLDAVISGLAAERLALSRLLLVHSKVSAPAELALVEARQTAPGHAVICPPLFLKDENGRDTPAALDILSGRFSQALHGRPDKRA